MTKIKASNKAIQDNGFSLIELLIVISVIAILTAIAIPMYSNYMLRAHRADAVSSLNLIAMNEEAWMMDNGNYTGILDKVWSGTTSTGGYYQVTLSAVKATGYTVIATPIGAQLADNIDCPNLTLTVDGGAVTRTPALCWE